MPTQQTTVNDDLTVAFAGTLVDQFNNEVASYVNEEAVAEMPFGVMLAQGTADRDALLPDAQADEPIGILVHSHAYNKDNELGSTGVKPDMTLGVLRKGRIWVQVADAVTPGDPVRYRTSGGNGEGTFQTAAAGGNTVDCSNFARFLTSAAADGLAQLEIDMTNAAQRSSD